MNTFLTDSFDMKKHYQVTEFLFIVAFKSQRLPKSEKITAFLTLFPNKKQQ